MTTLGQAWIEIHADTKPFSKELAKELKLILAEVEKLSRSESVKLGQGISQGIADGVDKDSERVRRSFERVGNGIRKEANSWQEALAAPFRRLARGNFILTRVFGSLVLGAGRITASLGRVGKAVIDLGEGLFNLGKLGALAIARFGEVVTGVGKDATLTLSKMGATATQVSASFAAFTAEAIAAAPALIALVAVALALGTAFTALVAVLLTAAAPFAGLVQLALLIPAAFSAIIAVVIPLVIAFKDLDKVMDLVFEKDPKKLKEGLAELSPVMQSLVMTLRPLRDLFNQMANAVQAGLIGPILTILGPALARIIPQLTVGFTLISTAIGNLLLSILRLVSQQAVIDSIVFAMGEIALFIERNTPAITTIITALGKAAEAALPVVLELLTRFTDFLTQFAEWIMGAITDGRFETWLNNGIADLESIMGLVNEIFGLFKDMFVALETDGREFLNILTSAIREFRDWIKSPQGQQALKDMARMAKDIASAFRASLPVLQQILSLVSSIWGFWRKIISNPITGGIGGQILGGSYSGGGVVPEDQIAMVHAGEPILDPANSVAQNKQILADAGMLDVLSEPTVVNVYLGSERLDERIDYRIGMNRANSARGLASGVRS